MSVVYSTHSHVVTLDPGGFVVRDRTGAALEVFNARHRAIMRADEFSVQGEAQTLFTPAPAPMPGQTTMGCGCPDDCNCRSPWRTNYCGCRQHTAV